MAHKYAGGCDHIHTHSDDDPIDNHTCHFGRGQAILLEREWIKRKTIEQRRLHHRKRAA